MITKLPELLPRKEAAGGGTRGGLKIWIRVSSLDHCASMDQLVADILDCDWSVGAESGLSPADFGLNQQG